MAVCLVLPRYEDQGRPFTSWVYAIAAHKVADAQRGFFARPATPIDEVPDLAEPSATPEERMIASLDIRVTNELIAKLPNKTRELLLLRVAGHSAEDVAERLDMTPGAVRVAHHRAITKLRQLATEAEPEEPPPIASQTQLNSVA